MYSTKSIIADKSSSVKEMEQASAHRTPITITTASSNVKYPKKRIIQDFLLIWMVTNIDQSKKDCQDTLAQLRNIINNVYVFSEPDKCIHFLNEIEDAKALLIVDGTLGQQTISLIHHIPQLNTIYIFCPNKSQHEKWSKEWFKINGVYTDVESIRECLQQVVKQDNQNSISMSFVTVDGDVSSQNLDQLEPSFMYTQIFKEILLEMEYNQHSITDFITYCRMNNCGSPNNITKFHNEYKAQSAVWWYTYPSFVFSLLNNALRILEVDTIINMGFFICDLHYQIQELYQQQIDTYQGKPFIVYRGQSLSTADFEKLRKSKGGLMSFNNFLSTSKDREISLGFTICALTKSDTVGILFEITIDPSISSALFAAIQEVGYYKTEEEILFSMHTVFRIGEISKLDKDSAVYQVELKLTADDDQQLRILTEHIRDETTGGTGWDRLGQLLFKLNQSDKAEKLCNTLLEQTSGENGKLHYYNSLGCVKNQQGHYDQAIWYHEKSLEIRQKTLPLNHPDLATSYNNIAGVYRNMGEYSKALSFYEKSLEIDQKTLPPNHPDLATSYNNIAVVYNNMGEYSKALSFYKKSLDIQQKSLPSNHPDLASSYNNIAVVYNNMGEYSKALSFYEKSLEIRQKALPPNHPSLASSYNNIAAVYRNMGEYSKALSFYEKSLEIRQNALPPNHPSLASSYNNIAAVYRNMGEYSKALSFYEKSLEIWQNALPPNHPSLASSYNNIAAVYRNMGEYSKALSFYEKSLEIRQKALHSNHRDLGSSYNNIAVVYGNMGEYSKALSFYEKSLEIRQTALSPNHPSLASSYNNIAAVYRNMEEYSKALLFFEKSLEIRQKSLPPNHPDLATSYNNIAELYRNMEEHQKALLFYEKSLEIQQKTLPPNHPDLATSYNNIAVVYNNMGEYSKALSYFEHALNIL